MPHQPQFRPRLLVLSLAAAFPLVHGNPLGGQVVVGNAVISQPAANLLQLDAGSHKTIVNWQQFSIGQGEAVRMNLPSAASAILNRVNGGDISQILGSLQSNGRVFLINPSGIVFGGGAQIDTAGFIASTLNISDADFLADRLRFSGPGGAIAQSGDMIVKGDVALIAASLSTSGAIRSENGNLMLAAGQTVELVDLATPALRYQVSAPENTVVNLGDMLVQNGAAAMFGHTLQQQGKVSALQAERGEGGSIVLRATDIHVGRNAELHADAAGQGKGGRVEVIASNTASVHGQLTARGGSQGGDGGFVETSGKQVQLDGINVDTRAAQGKTGQWLIDPTDLVIAASGGSMTGAALSAQLEQNNVSLQTDSTGSDDGNIVVNDTVSWSADTALNLSAHNDITINSQMTASGNATLGFTAGHDIAVNQRLSVGGNSARLVLTPGEGQLRFGSQGKLDISGSNATLTVSDQRYQLLRSQDELTQYFAAVGGQLAQGRFAIASDFDIASDFTTRQGLDGNSALLGLGHTLSGQQVPLLAQQYGLVSDLHLTNVSINSTADTVGALANELIANDSFASIRRVTVSGAVQGVNEVGGVVGRSSGGSLSDVSVSGSVTGNDKVGGLVGSGYASIDNSSNQASVTGSSHTGGLVGSASSGYIDNSSNHGSIRGGSYTGGLAGEYGGWISGSSADGSVSASGDYTGGLVGLLGGEAKIAGAEFNGNVSGAAYVGGLAGKTSVSGMMAGISDARSSGTVSGSGNYVGGVAGYVEVSDADSPNPGASYQASSSSAVSGRNHVGGIAGEVSAGNSVSGNFSGSLVTTLADGGETLVFTTSRGSGFYAVDRVTLNGARLQGGRAALFRHLNGDVGVYDISSYLANDSGTYLITSDDDLVNMLPYAQDGLNFRLTGNIDMGRYRDFSLFNFSGNFDGNGYRISHYSADNSAFTGSGAINGLFGNVGFSSTIHHLMLSDASVTGWGNVGLISGRNYGTISHVSVSGNATSLGADGGGSAAVGGVAGYSIGNLYNVTASGVITGSNLIGGLVGWIDAGTLTSGTFSGQLATSTSGSTVRMGGIIGLASSDGVEMGNNFYNLDTVTFQGQRMFTAGALYAEQYNRWEGAGRQLDIDSELTQVDGVYQLNSLQDWRRMLAFADGGYHFALGADLDLAADSGFSVASFNGRLDGAGHTLLNHSLSQTLLTGPVGLFGTLQAGSNINGLTLQGSQVSGSTQVGLLAGANLGELAQVGASGTVSGATAGGLVGDNQGQISQATVVATVTGSSALGGVAGVNSGTISNSSSTATLTAASGVAGGIAGRNAQDATISGSNSQGTLNGQSDLGGIAGVNSGSISLSTASMAIVASGDRAGGLAGSNAGDIRQSQSSGSVTGASSVGGAVGDNQGLLYDVDSSASVSGVGNVGGVAGINSQGGTIQNADATGTVSSANADGNAIGGLLGRNRGSVDNSTANGAVTAAGGISVGGLVGSNEATITASQATGAVSGLYYTGGLVGNNSGQVSDSSATGAVTGLGFAVGGLVGLNSGESATLDTVLASGQVSGSDDKVGGLVGSNELGAAIRSGEASGNVSGASMVGGLVGYNSGLVQNGTARGNVTASGNDAGGVAGVNQSHSSTARIASSTASGSVSGRYNVGGVVGRNQAEMGMAVISNSSASGQVQASQQYAGGVVGYNLSSSDTAAALVQDSRSSSQVGAANVAGGVVGRQGGNQAQLDTTTFGGTITVDGQGVALVAGGIVGQLDGGSVSNSFYNAEAVTFNGEKAFTRGALYAAQYNQWLNDVNSLDILAAFGAPDDDGRYHIGNVYQWRQLLAWADRNYSFVLDADIDLSQDSGFSLAYFKGSLDGGGHTVSGHRLSNSSLSLDWGLFGKVEAASSISDLTLSGSQLSALGNVGLLAGSNAGTLGNVNVAGVVQGGGVTGASHSGGLVGVNSGSIGQAGSQGTVAGTEDTGGLVGLNQGQIANSLSAAVVSATQDNAGGLVGRNSGAQASIETSQALGAVTGASVAGGLVGRNENQALVSDSQASGAVSGSSYVGGLVGVNADASIRSALASGNVTASGDYAGGLVGSNQAFVALASISASSASGQVSAGSHVGGLVGSNESGEATAYIGNSQASGNVSGSGSRVGGLVGAQYAYGSGEASIERGTASGVVSGQNRVGGLLGQQTGANASLRDSAFTGQASVTADSASSTVWLGGVVGELAGGTLDNSFYDVGAVTLNGQHAFTRGAMYSEQFARWEDGERYLDIDAEFARDNDGRYRLQSLQDWRRMLAWADGNHQFVLESDLDLSADNGFSVAYFAGSLDGGNHTLSGLNIAQAGFTRDAGLFGVVANGASLSQLKLTGASVQAHGNAGLLAGRNAGTISQVEAAGSVQGGGTFADNSSGGLVGLNSGSISQAVSGGVVSGKQNAGGLVGRNQGQISHASSTASVSATLGQVGGLVGSNQGYQAQVSDSSASGNVSTGSVEAGGLVGINYQGASISHSQASGTVSGQDYAGGLVGNNSGGLISDSEASGDVSGRDYVGGIAGITQANGEYHADISDSVARGTVLGRHYVGGVAGASESGYAASYISRSQASGTVSASGNYTGGVAGRLASGDYPAAALISDSSASGSVSGSNYVGGVAGTVAGQYASVLGSAFTGAASSSANAADGQVWLGGVVGYLAAGNLSNSYYNVGSVTLNGQTVFTRGALYGEQFARWQAAGRTLSIADELQQDDSGRYRITSLQDWRRLLAWADSSERFVLETDIDLAGDAGYALSYFTASLDGGGHTVRNLGQAAAGFTRDGGLFGYIGSSGAVSRLALSAASVSGSGDSGLLVGRNAGTLSEVSASGVLQGGGVNGLHASGGLVGNNSGSISQAGSQGAVSGLAQTGGLVGHNSGSISNSQSSATVSASGDEAGGLVGRHSGASASISDSTASGAVQTSADYAGGLVGRSERGSISSSQASGTVQGVDFVGGLVGLNNGSSITDSRASGNVTASGDYVGGLVGYNEGYAAAASISNSHYQGTVRGVSHVGGLVGHNQNFAHDASISQSSARGEVVASGDYAGGLVGYQSDNEFSSTSSIRSSFAIASVSGGDGVGGLVGYQRGERSSIANSYAQGVVRGQSQVGGLVGRNSGEVQQSYASVMVVGSGSDVGGLVGVNSGGVSASFWNIDAAGTADSAAGSGLTAAQMKLGSSYGWDFSVESPWRQLEGSSMPYLAWQFAGTPQLIAGNASGAAGQRVGVALGGSELGFAYAGADGRYSMLVNPASGSLWLAYTDSAAALYQRQQDVDLAAFDLGAARVSLVGPSLNHALVAQAAGSLSVPFTVSGGSLNIASGSSLQQQGVYQLTGNVSGGSSQQWLGSVSVQGDVALQSGGAIDFAGTVSVAAGQQLTLANGGSGGSFTVAGQLESRGNRSMDGLLNSGALQVRSGTLQLAGGGSQSGTFAVDGTLSFASGNWQLQDGVTLSGSGSFGSGADATVAVSGSQQGVTIAAGTDIDLDDLALSGSGKLVNRGSLSASGRQLDFSLDNRGTANLQAVTLTASVDNRGQLSLGQGSVAADILNRQYLVVDESQVQSLVNQAGSETVATHGVLDLIDNSGKVELFDSSVGTLSNRGELQASASRIAQLDNLAGAQGVLSGGQLDLLDNQGAIDLDSVTSGTVNNSATLTAQHGTLAALNNLAAGTATLSSVGVTALSNAGNATLSGGSTSTASNSGTLGITGGTLGTLTNSGSTALDSVTTDTVNNSATLTAQLGTLAALNNLATGTATLSSVGVTALTNAGNSSLSGGSTSTASNSGTLGITGGTLGTLTNSGSAALDSVTTDTVNNSATLTAQHGTLAALNNLVAGTATLTDVDTTSLSNAGNASLSGGSTSTASNSGVLGVTGGTLGTLTNSGSAALDSVTTDTVNNSATLTAQSGTLAALNNLAAGTATLSSVGVTALSNAGNATQSGGTIASLTNLATGTATLSDVGVTALTNAGNASLSGGSTSTASNSGMLGVTGGTLGTLTNSGSTALANVTTGTVNNSATLLLQGGTVNTFNNLVSASATLRGVTLQQLDNRGSLLVATRSRVRDTHQRDGVLTITAGESLVTDAGTFYWDGGQIVSEPGGLAFENGGKFVNPRQTDGVLEGVNLSYDNLSLPTGTMTMKSGSITLTGAVSIGSSTSFVLQGGRLINNSALTVSGSVQLSGGSYEGTGSMILQGGSLVRPLGSTVTWSNTGLVNNTATGTVELVGGSVASSLNNAGRMTVSGGTAFSKNVSNTGTLSLTGNAKFDGGLALDGGSIKLGTSGNPVTIDVASMTMGGGVLSGSGTINGNVDGQGGKLAVGYSPGELIINGNLTLSSGMTLEMELGGTSDALFDRIIVNGQANLAGGLNVVTWNGFAPVSNFTLSFIRYQSSSGAFSSISLPSGSYQTNQGASAFTVAWNGQSTGPVNPSVPSNGGGVVVRLADIRQIINRQMPERFGPTNSVDVAQETFRNMTIASSKVATWSAWAADLTEVAAGRKPLEICQ